MKATYLDHNATSPLRSCAQQRWVELHRDAWANAQSIHAPGVGSRLALEAITERVAAALGARPSEVIFTSGATESNHSAILSLNRMLRRERPVRWAIGAGEHPSAARAIEALEEAGEASRRVVQLTPSGEVNLEDLEAALETCDALCLQVANHETGVLTPLAAVAERVEAHDIPWHADAVQAIGRAPFRLDDGGARAITSASLSGHKLGGPRGVGALVWRSGREFSGLLPASSESRSPRAGTPDVPGIGAMCEALIASIRELEQGERAPIEAARDALEAGLLERFPGARVHGAGAPRLDNTLSISLPRATGDWPDGEALVLELAARAIAVSTGAACATGLGTPSPVLTAMAVPPEVAAASLRLSLGPGDSIGDLGGVLEQIHLSVKALDDH